MCGLLILIGVLLVGCGLVCWFLGSVDYEGNLIFRGIGLVLGCLLEVEGVVVVIIRSFFKLEGWVFFLGKLVIFCLVWKFYGRELLGFGGGIWVLVFVVFREERSWD